MIVFRAHHISIMILYAIAIHLWWTLMIWLDSSVPTATNPTALSATGLASLWKYSQAFGPPILLAGFLCVVALLALAALWLEDTWWIVWFLLPQQVILMG